MDIACLDLGDFGVGTSAVIFAVFLNTAWICLPAALTGVGLLWHSLGILKASTRSQSCATSHQGAQDQMTRAGSPSLRGSSRSGAAAWCTANALPRASTSTCQQCDSDLRGSKGRGELEMSTPSRFAPVEGLPLEDECVECVRSQNHRIN